MSQWEDRDPWEILGISPDASVEEIRIAYEGLERALAPGSLAVYSILDPDEQLRLQRQLRVAYQRALRAAGAPEPPPRPTPSPAAPPLPVAAPPAPPQLAAPPPVVAALNGGAEVTGAQIRAAREAWGLSADIVAKRTRIRPQYIAAIEAEDFSALPPRVFARGFVMTLARELGIDPDHAWRCFERRWAARGPIPRPELSRG